MDEKARYQPATDVSPDLSCHYLAGLLTFCREKLKDHSNLLAAAEICAQWPNTDTSVDWPTFLSVDKIMTANLDNRQLVEAGIGLWQHDHFRICQQICELLPGLYAAYSFAFGACGAIEKMLPGNLDIQRISARHFRVNLRLLKGYPPSPLLHQLLCGQLAALMGSKSELLAKVACQQTRHLVTFDIQLTLLCLVRHLARIFLTPAIKKREQTILLLKLFDKTVMQSRENSRLGLQNIKTRGGLAKLQYRYDIVSQHMTESLWVMDTQQHITFATASVSQWLGYSQREFLTLSVADLFAPESARSLLKALSIAPPMTLAMAMVTERKTVELRHQDGYWLPAEIDYCHLPGVANQPPKTVFIARSLSRVHQLQSEIQEVKANYSTLFQLTPEAIVILNDSNNITASNASASTIFGYSQEDLHDRPLSDLLPALTINDSNVQHVTSGLLSDTIAEQGPKSSFNGDDYALSRRTFNGQHKDGRMIPVEVSMNRQLLNGCALTTVIFRDNSRLIERQHEKQALQYQLLAAHRMESVGLLTGGVAHDFNNLLVAINGYTELCMSPSTTGTDRDTYLRQIQHAGGLAAELTNKLLEFSRPNHAQHSVIDVNDLLRRLNLLIRRLLPANIDLRIEESSDPGLVSADSTQLEQVIINLTINARDAMAETGTLSITTECQRITATECTQGREVRPGDYVIISITDSGIGISDRDLQHIFKAFYTTKAQGKGTGLGLSIVDDIVQHHRGFITIASTPGVGSTFRVHLPASQDGNLMKPSIERRKIIGGTETLLLVEDHDQVRDLAQLILRGVGYTVLAASDGDEALRIFTKQHPKIDLVIMDVVLPKVSGRDIAASMRAISSQVRLIYTSGYPYNGTHTRFILEQGDKLIQKPYSTALLCERIRSMLD